MPPQSVFGNRLACFLMRRLFALRGVNVDEFIAATEPAATT